MQDDQHENYLLKSILKNSPTSKNYTQDKQKSVSQNYYENFKEELLIKYRNKKLTDIKGSRIIDNGYCETLQITNTDRINFNLAENNFKQLMLGNLKLLPKIGLKKEIKLKKEGYNTIPSLTKHESYKKCAEDFMQNLESMSFAEILNILNLNRYSGKCRDNLIRCLSIPDCEDFKFMDIETLGLSNVPIILIGVAEIKNSKIISTQYFLRDLDEEISILDAYISHLDDNSVHVTFNGKTFDVPFIKNRLNYHRMNSNINRAHIDLMHYSKYLWGENLPNCRLQTIEKYKFGLERKDDVPGKYIPDYYNTYLDKGNIGPMIPIIEHNKQDIVSLADFLMKMYEEVNNN